MKKYNKSGFTLVELLAVIVIIMILVGFLMPALHGTKKQAYNKKAKAECMAITTAIISYKTDKRKWPVGGDNGKPDKTYGDEGDDRLNVYVINELILPKANPPYLDIGDFKTDSDGNVIDPWGEQYIIKIDTDYDGVLVTDEYNDKYKLSTNATVVVWSSGSDRARGNSNEYSGDSAHESYDNIVVWQ